jgi:hypothetical protein
MIADDIRHIDYNTLPISDYSRSYILRMLPHLDYYLDIYNLCISKLLHLMHQKPESLTVVDYGGGHGFLSCMLAHMGFGRVIYVDYNPQAVETIQSIKQHLGYGPDVILQGDASSLRQWCETNNIHPDGLLGMDVIEHIYRLETFFDDLYAIGPMPMIFTTGSTPYNPLVVRRLHKVMLADEHGHNGQPGFYQMRRQYLAEHLPQLSEQQLDYWAQHTRGLRFSDLLPTVSSGIHPSINDPYNTCDPATGSWTERILPIESYQKILIPHGAKIEVCNGFYNTHRSGVNAFTSQILNSFLKVSGPFSHPLAPFILLTITSCNV